MIKKNFNHSLPSGMQGFVFNTRRPIFADRRVRQALGLAFDFEWSNKNLFYGLYKRTQSYFDNSEMAAKGLPRGEELKLLNRYRDRLPPEIFKQPFSLEKRRATAISARSWKKLLSCWKKPAGRYKTAC